MLALCEQLGRRARDAAQRGAATVAVPEAIAAIAWVGERVQEAALRAEAEVWMASGASYHALVRLCARAVAALDAAHPPFVPRYREKVEDELEPMLALWPDVLVWPTTASLTAWDMIRLRAFPVHPLGLSDGMAWTDGAPAPPSEFFFHDLDHARYKVRQDLRAEGVEIPDAYQDGTTIDSRTGRHRGILRFAEGRVGDRLWKGAAARAAFGERLSTCVAAMGAGPLAVAAELLLFEIIHEKSFSLDAAVLRRELGDPAHLEKLGRKAATRFFPGGISDEVLGALPAARARLGEAIA